MMDKKANVTWFQGRLPRYIHAHMKTEAGINQQTIIEYITELVIKDLRQKGYPVDAALQDEWQPRQLVKE